MSSIEKLIKRFIENPYAIRYAELERILLFVGYVKVPAKGSHVKFKYQGLFADVIIPVHHNDCLNHYKKRTYKILLKNRLI